jgi:hypothetical protein
MKQTAPTAFPASRQALPESGQVEPAARAPAASSSHRRQSVIDGDISRERQWPPRPPSSQPEAIQSLDCARDNLEITAAHRREPLPYSSSIYPSARPLVRPPSPASWAVTPSNLMDPTKQTPCPTYPDASMGRCLLPSPSPVRSPGVDHSGRGGAGRGRMGQEYQQAPLKSRARDVTVKKFLRALNMPKHRDVTDKLRALMHHPEEKELFMLCLFQG